MANEAYGALMKGNTAKDGKEIEQLVYNILVDSYNKLLEEDYTRIKSELSVPVEEWFYEQEIGDYKNFKKRLDKAYDKSFGKLRKIRKKACKMAKKLKGKDEYDVWKLEHICSEAKAIENIAESSYKKIYNILKEKEK